MNERLYRARDERMFLGVLGGVSLRLGIDPSLVRIAYAIGTILTGIFPLIIVYFVMAIVIPEAPDGWEAAMRASAGVPAPPADWMRPREPGYPPPPPGGDTATDRTDAGGAAASGATSAAGAAMAGAAMAGAAGPAAAGPAGASWVTAPDGAATSPPPGPGPAWGATAGPAAGAGAAPGAPAADQARHASDARTGAIVGGLVLVGLGSAFLLAQVAPQVDWGLVGPVLLIVLGAVLVVASFRRA